ncbi:MAG: hypothetical protein JNJ57_09720 [Saprospiraceae bacterium]|nr:hypothetical protein [Saprospiraceae bacterium]
MDQTSLQHLIQTFSPIEKRDAKRFLNSPFFNQRKDLIDLFELYCHAPDTGKVMAWQLVVGAETYDDQKFRLLQSYLFKLLEKYLSTKELLSDEASEKLALLAAYRKRNATDAFQHARKSLEKKLAYSPYRNGQFHETQFKLLWETHQLNYIQNPTDNALLKELSRASDIQYLSQKLRLICLLAAHQSVYQNSDRLDDDQSVLALASKEEYCNLPAVSIYLLCYNMLTEPDKETHFQQFKSFLISKSGHFSGSEMHGLFILAINYCIRKINAGQDTYSKQVLELYQIGLEKTYLFENDQLSRFTYYNIVAIGIQTGELEWVRYFINEYKNRLEKKFRESMFSFNLARLEYALRNFGFVLELLQKANYRDILLNLSAKTLLLKTYHELGERDALESHMDAMRNYIHRKRIIGYHRTNYLNVVRYMEKLIRLNLDDRQAVNAFVDSVRKEPVLSEKSFFLNLGNIR